MKRKTFGVVFSVLLLLGGAVSLSLASSIPREKLGREEEISDKEIQQPSCEVPSDRIKITPTSEPVLLGKTGEASGEVAYSFSVQPLADGVKWISLLSGNPDVKFVEYVTLPKEDYLNNIEVGFEKNRVLRQSISEHLSPDGTTPCNATKWLETPVEKELAKGEEWKIDLEFPVELLEEKGVRPEGSHAWTMDGFSLYALLKDEEGQQALQEICFAKQDGNALEVSVFSRDLKDLAEIETSSEIITKELHDYRYIYASPEKVEPVYHCTHMDTATGTVLEGDLTLSHTTQMGDAVYAYYDGTVMGVKEGNAFSEFPYGESV